MSQLFEYPIFEADQVLTSKNLNDSIDYLTDQDLLTRRKLIGIGIACGLEVSNQEDTSLTISKGVGVTSLGYLIPLPKTELHYCKKYEDQASQPYDLFKSNTGRPYPLWEMFTHQEYASSDDSDIIKLTEATDFQLSEMAVLLYLEIIDKDLKSCIGEDCDEKGISRRHKVKRLLIHKSNLRKIIKKSLGMPEIDLAGLKGLLNRYCNMPSLHLPRYQYHLPSTAGYDHEKISTLDIFTKSYRDLIIDQSLKTGKALFKSYELFEEELASEYDHTNPFTGYDDIYIRNPLARKLDVAIQEEPLKAQYFYDFLKDLKNAYDEFLEVSCAYQASCCPSWTTFPLHLMLNEAQPAEGKSIYRHEFQPSLVVSSQGMLLNKLKSLHKRMVQMVAQLEVPMFESLSDIRITPGKTFEWSLSQQTPGFYYDKDKKLESLLPYWSYTQAEKCLELQTLNYHASRYFPGKNQTNPGTDPLLFNFDGKGFFRIEGHIGQERKSVFSHLEKQIQAFNLPFDVIEVALNKEGLEKVIDDCRYKDIQATYACNRAEFLACLGNLSKLLKRVLDSRKTLNESEEVDLNNSYEQVEDSSVKTGNDVYTYIEVYHFETERLALRLPEDISDFDPDKFLTSYRKVIAITQILSLLLQAILHLGLDKDSHVISKILGFVIILIRPLFDKLIDDCTDKKFLSLYKSYLERLEEYQTGKLFPTLSYHLPGYEHLGGVSSGGTFVLVYDEMPEEEGEETPAKVVEEEDDCFQTEQVKKMVDQSIYLSNKMESASFDEIWGYVTNYQKEDNPVSDEMPMNDLPAEKMENPVKAETHQKKKKVNPFKDYEKDRDYLKEEKDAVLEEMGLPADKERKVKKQRIIADFALPYRCCDKGLEVEEKEESAISIEKTEFCRRDKAKYPITVSPKGGTLFGDGVETTEGVSYFVPSNVTTEKVELTYLFEQSEAKITCHVYYPVAKYKQVQSLTPKGNTMYEFTNLSENADKVVWLINNQPAPSADGNLNVIPAEYDDEKIKVQLVAYRKSCKHATEPFVITEETDISLPIDQFCQNDDNKYPFSLTPEGGILTPMDGVIEKEGEYAFVPSTSKEKEIDFTYSVNGQTKNFKVTVHRPKAAFEEDFQNAEGVQLISKSEDHDHINWYINGQKKGSSNGIFIKYADYDSEVISVTLIAFSGECSDVYPETPYFIEKPVEETVFDLEKPFGSEEYAYCNNDTITYSFTTTPEGLTFGGDEEGISETSGSYSFTPNGLDPGTLEFSYGDEVITVLVKDAALPPINYELQDASATKVWLAFSHPPLATKVDWVFDGEPPIITDPGNTSFTKDFEIANHPDGVLTIELAVELKEGCFSTEKIFIDLKPLVSKDQTPGDTTGETKPDNLDGAIATGVSVETLLNDPKGSIFAEANDTSLYELKTTQDTFKQQKTDASWSSKLLKGDIAKAESAKFDQWLTNTSDLMVKNKENKEMTAYLTSTYVTMVSAKLALVENQASDLPKTGTVAKSLKQIGVQMDELAKQGINVRASKEWQSMSAYYNHEFSSKPTAQKALAGIS